jgi:hypothetical protein
MVTVTWAAAAEVITTDGAEDAVIITAGTAVDIAITTEIRNRRPRSAGLLDHSAGFDNFAIGSGIEDESCRQR